MSDRRFHNDLHIYMNTFRLAMSTYWSCCSAKELIWWQGIYTNVSFEFAHALKTRDIEESTVKCIVAAKLVSKQEIDNHLFATKPLTPRGHQGDSLLHCGASTARLDVVDFCIKVWKWKGNSKMIKAALFGFLTGKHNIPIKANMKVFKLWKYNMQTALRIISSARNQAWRCEQPHGDCSS